MLAQQREGHRQRRRRLVGTMAAVDSDRLVEQLAELLAQQLAAFIPAAARQLEQDRLLLEAQLRGAGFDAPDGVPADAEGVAELLLREAGALAQALDDSGL